MQTLKFKDKELNINASALAIVLYNKEFDSDLHADWGLVEYKTGQHLMVKAAYEAVKNEFDSYCKEKGIDPDDEVALNHLITGDDNTPPDATAEAITLTLIQAEKQMQESYDMEAATFFQIVYILNKSQRMLDKDKEISFEQFLIENSEMAVLDVIDRVKEEMKNVFTNGGVMETKTKKE